MVLGGADDLFMKNGTDDTDTRRTLSCCAALLLLVVSPGLHVSGGGVKNDEVLISTNISLWV